MLSSKATWQESNLHVQCCNYSLMSIRKFICKWMKTWIWLIDIHESQQTQPNHQLEYEWNDHKHVSWNSGWSFLHAVISSSFHSSRMDWWDEDDGSSSDSSRQHSTSNKQLDDQWERSCQWNAQGLTCQIYYWCKTVKDQTDKDEKNQFNSKTLTLKRCVIFIQWLGTWIIDIGWQVTVLVSS